MKLSIKNLSFVVALVGSVGVCVAAYHELPDVEPVDLGVIQDFADLQVDLEAQGDAKTAGAEERIVVFSTNLMTRAAEVTTNGVAEQRALMVDVLTAQDLLSKLQAAHLWRNEPNKLLLTKISNELTAIVTVLQRDMPDYAVHATEVTGALDKCLPEKTVLERAADFFRSKSYNIFARYKACNQALKSAKFAELKQVAIQARLNERPVEENVMRLAESLQALHYATHPA